jgi:ADP-ribose pyrophosphatase YjhB (NUDIX family)
VIAIILGIIDHMTSEAHPIPKKEFDAIFSRVPRLTVEVVVKNASGAIYLAKRAIPPCEGQWHLPGGTVRFGELLIEAVQRIAKHELGIVVQDAALQGYIEYPSHFLHGLDSPVGLVFEVEKFDGKLTINDEASDSGWFKVMPQPMHADQDEFLVQRGYLSQK